MEQPIKQKSADLSAQQKALTHLQTQYEETLGRARLPRPGYVEQSRRQDPLASCVSYVQEVYVDAEGDLLETLQAERQEEIGKAFLEGRKPSLEKYDAAISEIEGARAALPILERQIEGAEAELKAVKIALQRMLVPVFADRFEAAHREYLAALDGVRAALGGLQAVANVADRLNVPGHWDYQFRLLANDLHLVVLRKDREGAIHARPVEWLAGPVNVPSAAAEKTLIADMADQGLIFEEG